MERTERLRCGKQTKTEWWDTECLDHQTRCVVDGDCSHSKRTVRERWKSTCLELTLCNHEFLPHRERLRVSVPFHGSGPSMLAFVTVKRRV